MNSKNYDKTLNKIHHSVAFQIASVVALVVLLILSPVITLHAYKGVGVKNGGHLTGVIMKSGRIPRDPVKFISKDRPICGRAITAEKYVISRKGEIRWAVVSLEGIRRGKKFSNAQTNRVLTNTKCRFDPHVMVARRRSRLIIKNSDDTLHNAHFFLMRGKRRKNIGNVTLPFRGLVVKNRRVLRKSGLISAICDAHNFMQGYIVSVDHPYAEVSDRKGRFSIRDIPAGVYRLKVWHEALGVKRIRVVIRAGKTTRISVRY